MSSTNRGSKRVQNDFYETPSWCVEAILPHLPLGGSVLDPCAGKGAILRACAKSFDSRMAIEINEDFEHELQQVVTGEFDLTIDDAGAINYWPKADVVLMNPPFSKAEQFVRMALSEQRPYQGITCALLRLPFLASKKRADFLRANPPDVYVLSKRPSFNGIGTDSCDYAWFVWGPGRGGRWVVLP